MATAKDSDAIVFSPSQRKLIVDALTLKIASLNRAIRASTNPAVASALEAERLDCEQIALSFR